MIDRKTLTILIGFLVFSVFFASETNLSLAGYKSVVLLLGLLVAMVAGLILKLDPDEFLVAGLVFAMPMVDRMVFLPALRGRVIEDLLLYFAVPVVLVLLVKGDRSKFLQSLGVSFGDKSRMLRTTACLLGLAAAMAFLGLLFPSMTNYYPIWQGGPDVTASDFLYNEFMIAVVMFSGEFFFRGLVLFTLAKRSFWGAIVFQSLPYAFLHLGKPGIEVPYSLVAGLIFGWANLRSRSILPSWTTHFVGSALFDGLILLSRA